MKTYFQIASFFLYSMRGALRASVFVALAALLSNGLVEQTTTLSSSSSPAFSSLPCSHDGFTPRSDT